MDDQTASGGQGGAPDGRPRPAGRSSTMGLMLAAAAVVVVLGGAIAVVTGDWINAGRAFALAGVLALGALDRLKWGGRSPVVVDVATLAMLAVFVVLLFLGN